MRAFGLTFGMYGLRTDRKLAPRKDWRRSFRLRLWRLRQHGQPANKILCGPNVRLPPSPSVAQDPRRADSLPYPLAIRPWGTPLEQWFSSRL